MTTLEGAAPAQADTAAPTNTPAQAVDQATTGAAGGEGWVAALDEDTRVTAEAKGWSKLKGDEAAAQVLRSYAELQKKTGSALIPPKEDATPEEHKAFAEQLAKVRGLPEKPEDITFEMPADLPEGLAYDEGFANEAKTALHEAFSLPPKEAAQKLHDFWVSKMGAQHQAYADAMIQSETEATAALEKAWGKPDTETHKASLAFVNRAIREAGGEAVMNELKAFGIVGPKGQIRAPGTVAMLARLAEHSYAEAKAPTGQAARGADDGLEVLYPKSQGR